MLQRSGIGPIAGAGSCRRKRTGRCAATRSATLADLTTEAFRIAGEHLSETEILECVTAWIKEEKSSFLVRALEQLDTPLGEIIEAIERYRHTDIDESELSLSIAKGSARLADPAVLLREPGLHQRRARMSSQLKISTI